MEAKSDKQFTSCQFCDIKPAIYTCPRCNVGYCSVSCYKDSRHLQCSEEFYHDLIVDHLKNADNSESKTKMMEILSRKKVEEELDSDDDDDLPSLDERLAGVNLDDDSDVWERLTEAEKTEFKRLLDNNTLSILPEWEPWWHFKKTVKFVEELDDSDSDAEPTTLPSILPNIPLLSSLSKVKPSPYLKYILLNCFYGYAYLVKFYNGDHHCYPVQFIMSLIKVSESLENKCVVWKDSESSITAAMQQIQNDEELSNSKAYLVEIINEVKCLIEGGESTKKTDYTLRALTDIVNITNEAKSHLRKEQTSSKETRKILNLVAKKVLYYLSWTRENGINELESLIVELTLIHDNKFQEVKRFEELKSDVTSVMEQLKPSINNLSSVEEITSPVTC